MQDDSICSQKQPILHFSTKVIDNSLPSSSPSSLTYGLNDNSFIPRLAGCAKDMFRKPCVYMLNEGRCMRSDCRFAHDLHNITCKYWLEGECLKGESCEFLHDFPRMCSESAFDKPNFSFQKYKNSDLTDTLKNEFSLNTSDFPELGSNYNLAKQQIVSVKSEERANYYSFEKTEVLNSSPIDQFKFDKTTYDDNNSEDVNSIKPGKKTRKFKENVLYSLSLPAFAITNRKKNIN